MAPFVARGNRPQDVLPNNGSAVTQTPRTGTASSNTGPTQAMQLLQQMGLTDYFTRVQEEGFLDARTPNVFGELVQNRPSIPFQGEDLQEGAEALAGTFLTDAISGVGDFLHGPPEEEDTEGNELKARLERDHDRKNKEAATSEEAAALLRMQEQLATLGEGILTPDAQQQIEAVKEDLAIQLDAVESDLKRQNDALRIQDSLAEFQFNQAGIDFDIGPLADAVGAEGGLGGATMQAIMDIADSVEMTVKEKEEATGLVLNRFQFSDAIVNEVQTLIQREQDLETLLASPNVEDFLSEATYVNPTFPNVVVVDDDERFTANFLDDFEVRSGLVIDANDEEFTQVFDAARTVGFTDPTVIFGITQLAARFGMPYETLADQMQTSVGVAQADQDALETALSEPDQLAPGSREMAYALGSAASNHSFTADEIQLMSNSMGLHAIIQAISNGEAGFIGNGTIRGVGGLQEDTYALVMDNVWTENRGMDWELTAMWGWIDTAFDGDPLAAIQYYMNTGSWGDTAAIEGGLLG